VIFPAAAGASPACGEYVILHKFSSIA
jgi:hypothetical protein